MYSSTMTKINCNGYYTSFNQNNIYKDKQQTYNPLNYKATQN